MQRFGLTSNQKTAPSKKSLNSEAFFNFFAPIEVVTGHRRNAGIRAGGHLRGHLGFAKHFPGTLASTPGALWNGKLVARSLGNAFAARKTDRLHIYKGFWAKVPGTL